MASDEPRITGPTLKVLGALLSSNWSEQSGAQIARATGLSSGTLYPLLSRLESARWLVSRWEREDPAELGRPRRRLYRLTEAGIRSAKDTHQDLKQAFAELSWAGRRS